MEKKKRTVRNYAIRATYHQKKKSDSNTGDYIRAAFIPVKACPDCRDVSYKLNSYIGYNKETGKIFFSKKYMDSFLDNPNEIYSSLIMSVSLILYRLICLFKNPAVSLPGYDDQDTPWQIVLKHRTTGFLLTIYEYRGALRIATQKKYFNKNKTKIFAEVEEWNAKLNSLYVHSKENNVDPMDEFDFRLFQMRWGGISLTKKTKNSVLINVFWYENRGDYSKNLENVVINLRLKDAKKKIFAAEAYYTPENIESVLKIINSLLKHNDEYWVEMPTIELTKVAKPKKKLSMA